MTNGRDWIWDPKKQKYKKVTAKMNKAREKKRQQEKSCSKKKKNRSNSIWTVSGGGVNPR